jgi:hypothetical protein
MHLRGNDWGLGEGGSGQKKENGSVHGGYYTAVPHFGEKSVIIKE